MSTRSRIGIKNDNGTITSIYCHSDGYLGGVGAILADYYPEEEDVRALLAVGDLSELGVEVGDKIGFDQREWRPSPRGRGWVDQALQCVAYGRDRGDVGTGARVSASFGDLKREHLLGSFGPDHYTSSIRARAGGGSRIPFLRIRAGSSPRSWRRYNRR